VEEALKLRAARCPTLPIGLWAGWAFALQRAGWVGSGRLIIDMSNNARVKYKYAI